MIRPVERADMPAVAALYERVARSGRTTPAPGLARYFEEELFDAPWSDRELGSLVYVDGDGRIAGFLGARARRLDFGGRPIRATATGQLVTEPRVRSRAAGAFLIRDLMNGPQDLTFTDTATEEVRRIWEGLGGETFHLASTAWVRPFRLVRSAVQLVRGERDAPVTAGRRGLLGSLEAAWRRLPSILLRPRPPSASVEPLTPDGAVEHLTAVVGSFRVRPAYDEPFLAWAFAEMSAVKSRGELVRHLVRGGDARVLGWYVYYLQPGAMSPVVQLVANERDVGEVLDALFHDSWSRGASAVHGRVEPHLREALRSRRCLCHATGYVVLLHSRDRELLHAIQSGRGLLTRLDGDWWMGHGVESIPNAQGVGREDPPSR